MPQPTDPTHAPAAPAVPQSESEKQIARAKELEKARAALIEKIGANREYLRLMSKNDALTAEQNAWLADFYPVKEKGEKRSEDDIEATRKAKAAARES